MYLIRRAIECLIDTTAVPIFNGDEINGNISRTPEVQNHSVCMRSTHNTLLITTHYDHCHVRTLLTAAERTVFLLLFIIVISHQFIRPDTSNLVSQSITIGYVSNNILLDDVRGDVLAS